MPLHVRPHCPRRRRHPWGRHLRPIGVRGQRGRWSVCGPFVSDRGDRLEHVRTVLRRTWSKSSESRLSLRLQLRHRR